MESTALVQKTTSPSRPGLELVNSTAEQSSKADHKIIPVRNDCKTDLETLDILCIEIMQFMHSNIGASLTQKILTDSRGQQ